MQLSLEEKQVIVDFLVQKLDPLLIYLYGSYAKGKACPNSDVDLAFYANQQSDPYEIFLLANQLAMQLRKDVDLVDLRTASTVFRAQVISTGELLLCSDRFFKENYEIRVLKEYTKLNEERKEILEAIREEGSIYGRDSQ